MPFAGQGEEPSTPTTVFVSSYIDRLMYIDDKNYEFQALVFVYLSWTDPRAREAVANNTARLARNSSEACKMQCQLYPQNQPNPATGCCDNVWLPYVSFPTLKMLSQDRLMRWGVNIEPNSDAVAYWSIILGTFMASFDLKAFPFDTQRLHVQMEIPGWAGGNVVLKPSSAGTRMFNTNPDGDALSGWRVVAVRMARYNMSLCSRYTVSSSQPSAADDPAPLVSELLFSDPRIQAKPGACAAVLGENPKDPSFLAYTRQNLDGSEDLHQDHPLNVTGVTCTVIIRRYTAQWVMSAIFPITASTWLGFVVFLLPRDCINSRLGAVMTIFVALAAIQFVVSQDLPNSSYLIALQQLIAAGYFMLILIGIESVLVWWITTYHQTGERLAAHLAAQKQYREGLKSELTAVKARLAAMLAEQEQLNPKKSLSYSFARVASLKLSMHRSSKARKALRADTSTRGQTPPAAATAAAQEGLQQQQQKSSHWQTLRQAHVTRSEPLLSAPELRAATSGGPEPADRDVPPKVGASADQIKQARQVVDQVEHLEQQLAALDDDLQQGLGSAGRPRGPHSFTGPMLGLPTSQPQPNGVLGAHPLSPDALAAAAAGDDDGAVKLDVDVASDAGQPQVHRTAVRGGCFYGWRLCTRMRVYMAALKQDKTLTDQLAHQINKWLGIVQFVAYNITVVLIFVVNWALYRKH